MEFEEALKLVDEVLFVQKKRHLSDPEMTILQGTWQGISYDEMSGRSQYSMNYLMRDVGPNLWRSLSEILGEKISKINCRAVLTRYSHGEREARENDLWKTAIAPNRKKQQTPATQTQIKPQIPSQIPSQIRPNQDWGKAPDLVTFYGRTQELQTLEDWIVREKCRLVCLWGMGGIGKTTLARQLVENIQDDFDYLFWRSLQKKPSLADLCAEILSLFSEPEKASDRSISSVLKYLQHHRCLLIFDDVEAIIQNGDRLEDYHQDDETYQQFFKQVGETVHQSCLLLNSQEKIREIIPLENSTKLVHAWELSGLNLEAAEALFQDKNLTGKASWPDFVALYQGNPLALNLILVTIQKFFNGDVSKYVKLKTTYLPPEIVKILQERCANISQPEIEILTHLADSSRSLSLLEIHENICPDSEIAETIAAIESLQGRSLLEIETYHQETNFKLQPVVKKYVKKYLKKHDLS